MSRWDRLKLWLDRDAGVRNVVFWPLVTFIYLDLAVRALW